MSAPCLVFVYGSLRRGNRHHEEMLGAEFMGPATLGGHRLVLYQGGYPALVAGAQDSRVEGEVYRVSAGHLARLDEFEDTPTLYQRVEAQLSDGQLAFVYMISPELAVDLAIIDGWSG